MWEANVFTIFPEIYPGTLAVSNIGKALHNEQWKLNVIDLKNFADRYGRIDDTPYGGGAGMVLSPAVFANAFESLTQPQKSYRKVYFSPRGKSIKQSDFQNLSQSKGVTFLCGRYEGIDQRIIDIFDFEEWSIGDFVLTNGDIGALLAIDGCVRLLPGVVQKQESIENDSFSENLLEYDHYTKPFDFQGIEVPHLLISGNHAKIKKWKLEQSKNITKQHRPDIWAGYVNQKLRDKIVT